MQRPGCWSGAACDTNGRLACYPPPALAQEASCHLFSTTSGNKHHLDRRPAILSLLREAGDLVGWRLDKVEASPLLPVEQLMADSDLPRSSGWWNNVPFADWVHPAAEAVGSSM